VSSPLSDYAGPLSSLEIHLDQIRRNYLALQKRLVRGCDCAAVVKADAYGLGGGAVADELYKANCRHFYVAHAAEGVAVRQALGVQDAHIYLLHGPRGIAPTEIIQHQLTPVLNTPRDIEYWSGFAKASGKKLPAVIHIDTGMNRLGLTVAETGWLKNNAALLQWLDIRYLMSHLACADEPAHLKNTEQLEKFRQLTALLGLPSRLSFANSSGIFLGADYHFDQARPGCALYGINPQNGPNPMHNVVTLRARILQIRDAVKGETVGYGATYQVPKPAKLATISAGYADGYLRSLSARGMVSIAGQKCPVVGRVSMDAIVADITAVLSPVHAGDWAEIIGPHQSVDDVAAQAGTIGYEILTSLGRRYTKVYTGQE
jgi:alanine racemase